jgi:hypothetical protein
METFLNACSPSYTVNIAITLSLARATPSHKSAECCTTAFISTATEVTSTIAAELAPAHSRHFSGNFLVELAVPRLELPGPKAVTVI